MAGTKSRFVDIEIAARRMHAFGRPRLQVNDLEGAGVPSETVCPVCDSTDLSVFCEIDNAPVHIGLQWNSSDAARDCPKGDIKLALCGSCGFITNISFEPARLEYSVTYDNSLHYSPFFRNYAEEVATRLIERYGVRNKDVIEIGCGKGDFLKLLCELGNNRGTGFDPSFEGDVAGAGNSGQVRFVQDFYSERYSEYDSDLICCRFVFEHIAEPMDFLTMVRRAISKGRDTVVHFEVPNVLSILRDLAIWDIIYEHCSYFSCESLAAVFAKCGFDDCEVSERFRGQYLSIEAKPSEGSEGREMGHRKDSEEISGQVAFFVEEYRTKMETWRQNLERISRSKNRVVLWGAGSKAVSFLNMLSIGDEVGYVVDLNPNKQGKYIAGTGHRIVPSEFLREFRPDTVIVMNPAYCAEIEKRTKSMGLAPEFLTA